MNDRIWPNEPRGKDKYIPWLTKLLRAAKMSALKEVKVIGGVAKLQPGTDGTVLVITPPLGVGGGGGFIWQSPNKELNPLVAVPKDTFVFISSDNPLVTTGIVDLASGTLTKAQPGFWQATQAVPAQVTISNVVEYNVPQYPYPGDTGYDAGPPVSGDLDDADIFWIYWGALNC